jgi:ABC-type dipeptide/oligopeptide/nickel transport system permease subunit
LGFLGLGAPPDVPEWGNMLQKGRTYIFSAPHIVVFPGLATMLVVLGFSLLGDGLRDALDPRLAHTSG